MKKIKILETQKLKPKNPFKKLKILENIKNFVKK